MNCTQCATEIKDESANFCQNCAAPVTRGVTQPKQMGTDGATESSQESKSEPVAVSEFGELKISQVPKSWNPIKRYGLLAVVILIVAISVLIFVRNVNDGSNAQEAFPSGCVALETNINQSTGSERVKFMKLA
ncbi:MAG: hypothetical protein F2641_02620, partial [Actinobacteria bacterium]|nr:hypothetical protein [Actinomycetota bacterium]